MSRAATRELLVRSERTDGDLFARAPIASLLVDGSGAVSWYNAAAAELFDLPTDLDGARVHRIGGPRLSDLFVDLEGPVILSQVRFALDGTSPGRLRLAATLRRADRRTTPVDVHVARLDDDCAMLQVVDPPASPERSALEQERAFCDAVVALNALVREEMEPADFYRRLVQRVIDVVPGAQAGSLLLRRPGSDEFSFVAAEGFDLAGLQQEVLTADELVCGLEVSTAIVTEIDNSSLPEKKQRWLDRAGRTAEIRASIAAPVSVDGEPLAFLNVNSFSSEHAFDSSSVEMATIFSRLVGDLINRRRAERDLRREGESYKHLANHDPLTGLPNRRRIEEAMIDVASSTFGERHSMALLFADLDDFKSVNDTYGHDAGDHVLKVTARRLKKAMRGHDIVGRWGGDEFVIVAPDVESEEAALALGERILERCPDLATLPDGNIAACRLSIGVVWSQNGSEGLWAMLSRADDALYRAKHDGKGVARLHRR